MDSPFRRNATVLAVCAALVGVAFLGSATAAAPTIRRDAGGPAIDGLGSSNVVSPAPTTSNSDSGNRTYLDEESCEYDPRASHPPCAAVSGYVYDDLGHPVEGLVVAAYGDESWYSDRGGDTQDDDYLRPDFGDPVLKGDMYRHRGGGGTGSSLGVYYPRDATHTDANGYYQIDGLYAGERYQIQSFEDQVDTNRLHNYFSAVAIWKRGYSVPGVDWLIATTKDFPATPVTEAPPTLIYRAYSGKTILVQTKPMYASHDPYHHRWYAGLSFTGGLLYKGRVEGVLRMRPMGKGDKPIARWHVFYDLTTRDINANNFVETFPLSFKGPKCGFVWRDAEAESGPARALDHYKIRMKYEGFPGATREVDFQRSLCA